MASCNLKPGLPNIYSQRSVRPKQADALSLRSSANESPCAVEESLFAPSRQPRPFIPYVFCTIRVEHSSRYRNLFFPGGSCWRPDSQLSTHRPQPFECHGAHIIRMLEHAVEQIFD